MRFDVGGGLVLDGNDGPLLVTSFDPGAAGVRSQDVDNPVGNGRLFGRDRLGAPTWTFDVVTTVDDGDEAMALAARLLALWRRRFEPGETVALRYRLGGRWRRVYGRPGRFVGPDGGRLTVEGAASILATFRLADELHYGDDEHTASVGIVPASTGGLTLPATFPWSGVSSGEPRAGAVRNDGDADAPVLVRFYGPVRDPWLSGPGWELRLRGSLAWDRWVEVDARAATVLRDDGASVAGMLSRRSRLSSLRLPPGDSQVRYGGVDGTGTSRVEVRWRDAWWSL
ncbi:hypothetical protein [Georgenia sp. MJ170]|uniref:hypothetical protein n=1 Tax=Georgenia sunbinii TaxID=3117728 RepID=UPI002F266B72